MFAMAKFVYITARQKVGFMPACLSHRWGQGQMMRMIKETLSLYTREISWESIPRTFQDAITFARHLGLAYIWIDSLCIVQDDLMDWQEQSGIMTTIYSNSYITLAAAVSDGPESGIFTKGQRYHGTRQTLAHFTRDGVNIPILARRRH
jgi:hypothetical protein